jgi:hypothetical protein
MLAEVFFPEGRMRAHLRIASAAISLLLAFVSAFAAAPTTQQQSDLAQIKPETWEQDNARLKEHIVRLNVQLAELEKRKPPATRPAPATSATSRPVAALMSENRRLVTAVNDIYGRIAKAKNQASIIGGVSEISITFACENHTIDEVSDILGMTGQLMSEKEGKLSYEWLFKIQGEGHRIMEVQPFVCEVVDGKVVSNQMLERRKLGTKGLPMVTPPPTLNRR